MVVPGGKGSLRAFSPESLAGVCCLTRGSMLRRLPGPFGVWACGTENTVQAARVRPVACQCRGGEGSVTLVAEGRRESRKQKAEGRRQKAEGRGETLPSVGVVVLGPALFFFFFFSVCFFWTKQQPKRGGGGSRNRHFE